MASTIVVDTSAIMAILLQESTTERLVEVLIQPQPRLMGAASLAELLHVAHRRAGRQGWEKVRRIVDDTPIEIHPFDAEQARMAAEALARFGKGRHPAALNLGDAFSYATARSLRAPLLAVGDDFPQTDLALVPW